jgi:hypothetical protein
LSEERVVAGGEYEGRYQFVLSGIWVAYILPELGTGEASQTPKADPRWDIADVEADEQARAIEEAIEFADFNADRDLRDYPEGFIERIEDGIAAWDRPKGDTGFDSLFTIAQVRATSSGAASSFCMCSSTAPSTSAAGTLVTAQVSYPSAIASRVT